MEPPLHEGRDKALWVDEEAEDPETVAARFVPADFGSLPPHEAAPELTKPLPTEVVFHPGSFSVSTMAVAIAIPKTPSGN